MSEDGELLVPTDINSVRTFIQTSDNIDKEIIPFLCIFLTKDFFFYFKN